MIIAFGTKEPSAGAGVIFLAAWCGAPGVIAIAALLSGTESFVPTLRSRSERSKYLLSEVALLALPFSLIVAVTLAVSAVMFGLKSYRFLTASHVALFVIGTVIVGYLWYAQNRLDPTHNPAERADNSFYWLGIGVVSLFNVAIAILALVPYMRSAGNIVLTGPVILILASTGIPFSVRTVRDSYRVLNITTANEVDEADDPVPDTPEGIVKVAITYAERYLGEADVLVAQIDERRVGQEDELKPYLVAAIEVSRAATDRAKALVDSPEATSEELLAEGKAVAIAMAELRQVSQKAIAAVSRDVRAMSR